MIRAATIADAAAIAKIYNHYITQTIVTFEEEEIGAEEMGKRIREIIDKFPFLVFEVSGQVLGYAYASPWKSRCAYRFSVESTIYLSPEAVGAGIGTALYSALMKKLEELNLHSIIGGVALPNDASVALHVKLGFEKVAEFREVGFKFGKWIDVGYWEKIITKE